MNKLGFFVLTIILLVTFILRLYKFNNPVADWHSWRQADTSAVSRNFVLSGFDILHPKFDDLSNVPSGLDNPEGFRFVEFPIYNIFQAGLFMLFPAFTLEQWGRLLTIFSCFFSTILIYLLVKKYANSFAALLSAFFFAFLPFNIYYGRVILPDPMMVTAILAGIYFFDRTVEEKFQISNFKCLLFFILSIIFTSAALLLKPYALFFTLPMLYLIWKTYGFKFLLKWRIWIFAILAITPLIFWRFWMQQYPEGIPVNSWLFNGGNIRFKPSFFYWIFADRIGREILGYWGFGIFIFGILSLVSKFKKQIQDSGLFLSFLLSSLLYIFVIARGNVQHDYYQILIIPTIAIFLGLGTEFLLNRAEIWQNKYINYSLAIICITATLFFAWYNIRDFFNINYSIVNAGLAVDKLIPKNAKVIAINDGDTSFLYQTKRRGWASFEKSLPEMVKMGADYLVLHSPKEPDYGLGREYKIISTSPDYILFDLHKNP